MLVLTRRPDESIVFPGLGVTVQVVRINGSIARIGVDAPPELRVLRGELMAGRDDSEESPQLRKAIRSLLAAQTSRARGAVQEAEAEVRDAMDALTKYSVPSPAPRALLVDDDPNQRELLSELMRTRGWECDTAEDGEHALKYLEESRRPDLVVLDMRMPRVDGPTLVRTIRSDPRFRDLKLFALSGTPPESVGLTRGRDGVDDWFAKPINTRKFWTALKSAAPLGN